MDSDTRDQIVAAVIATARAAAPDMTLRQMYGGTVFELENGIAQSRIGGVYGYDAHVSVEFAQGALFDDPFGRLNGKGKARRHLKLRAIDEIEGQDLASYLDHAITLYRMQAPG